MLVFINWADFVLVVASWENSDCAYTNLLPHCCTFGYWFNRFCHYFSLLRDVASWDTFWGGQIIFDRNCSFGERIWNLSLSVKTACIIIKLFIIVLLKENQLFICCNKYTTRSNKYLCMSSKLKSTNCFSLWVFIRSFRCLQRWKWGMIQALKMNPENESFKIREKTQKRPCSSKSWPKLQMQGFSPIKGAWTLSNNKF